jgi:integrase
MPRYQQPEELKRLHEALAAREAEMVQKRTSFNDWRRDRNMSTFPELDGLAFVDHLRPMTLLALNTGLRRGEIFNLAWADCTLKSAAPSLVVHGKGSKSGKTRHVPLNRPALDTLTKWKEQTDSDGLVFPSPVTGARFDNINTAWREVVSKAQLPGFKFHDTRHHFASMLVQKGVDLNVVRELLGHADLKLTMRYAHLAPHNAAAAVALLALPENVIPMKRTSE